MLTVYDYDKGFEVIDWDSMAIEGNSDPYVKQVKMAECLTDQTISIDDISYIYVSCEEAEQYVHKMLNSFNVNSRRHINIQPIWFNRGVF